MKILIFLQNAYMNKSSKGKTIPYNLWYYLFKNCHSGRRTSKIFGSIENMNNLSKNNNLRFTNTTPLWGIGANSKLSVDLKHVKEKLKDYSPDLVIACGKQAEEVLVPLWDKCLIVMPHPASRTLTNNLLDSVKNHIETLDLSKISRVSFKQEIGKHKLELI